jgi:hypothetical protein
LAVDRSYLDWLHFTNAVCEAMAIKKSLDIISCSVMVSSFKIDLVRTISLSLPKNDNSIQDCSYDLLLKKWSHLKFGRIKWGQSRRRWMIWWCWFRHDTS